jgi:hypothetical protein
MIWNVNPIQRWNKNSSETAKDEQKKHLIVLLWFSKVIYNNLKVVVVHFFRAFS